jgi:endoglucanase
MVHFVKDDGLNAFRLPVAWQYLIANDIASNTLSATNFPIFDELMQGCIKAGGKFCIIDMHNYARYEGQIIGQGGPTDAQFASIWGQLAKKYAGTPEVVFGIMNEPHDEGSGSNCPGTIDITKWAATVQAAVTAIRSNGATSQTILLPGKNYDHATTYLDSDGSGPALLAVSNPDGSKDNLVIDVHEYLDSDGSGSQTTCSRNPATVANGLGDLATFLRKNGRKAFLSETGGANNQGCVDILKQELGFLK